MLSTVHINHSTAHRPFIVLVSNVPCELQYVNKHSGCQPNTMSAIHKWCQPPIMSIGIACVINKIIVHVEYSLCQYLCQCKSMSTMVHNGKEDDINTATGILGPVSPGLLTMKSPHPHSTAVMLEVWGRLCGIVSTIGQKWVPHRRNLKYIFYYGKDNRAPAIRVFYVS